MNGGIKKEEIISIDMFLMPIRIFLPFFIAKFSSQEKSLIHFFNTIPYR